MNYDPHIKPGDMGYQELDFKVQVYRDGTRTLAEVYVTDSKGETRLIAVGTAARKKGEVRNVNLGDALAIARAFEELSRVFGRVATEEAIK